MSEGITPNQLTPVVPVFKATVILTDAQIKALPTTPVEIVAAQGVGKGIIPFYVIFASHIVADYNATIAVDASLAIITDNLLEADAQVVSTLLRPNAFVADDKFSFMMPALNIGEVVGAMSIIRQGPITNDPLTVSMYNGDPIVNLTGGNAANTLKVVTLYAIIDLEAE